MPLFPYTVDVLGFGLSIDRFLFFVLAFAFAIRVASSGKLRVNAFFYFCLFGLLGLAATTILAGGSENATVAMAFYCSALTCLLVIFPVSWLETLEKGIVYAFFIYVMFLAHGVVSWYAFGQAVTVVPFSEYLPFLKEAQLVHAAKYSASYSNFPRLAFPFATPPHLSIVSAMYTLYFMHLLSIGEKLGGSQKIFYVLLVLAVVIAFSTISRSGIFTMILGCLAYLFLTGQIREMRRVVTVMFLLFSSATVFIMLDPVALPAIYERVSNTTDLTIGSVGHYSSRVDAVNYILDYTFWDFLFGVGVGNYPDLHTHMSSLTVLVERGLLGFLTFVGLFLMLILKSRKIMIKSSGRVRQEACFSLAIGLMFIIGHSAYEFSYLIVLWVFLAIAIRRVSISVQRALRE